MCVCVCVCVKMRRVCVSFCIFLYLHRSVRENSKWTQAPVDLFMYRFMEIWFIFTKDNTEFLGGILLAKVLTELAPTSVHFTVVWFSHALGCGTPSRAGFKSQCYLCLLDILSNNWNSLDPGVSSIGHMSQM